MTAYCVTMRYGSTWLRLISTSFTKKQAGIAIRIESIAAVDGVGVGPFHRLQAAESRYQHEQRRARQVKIGQEDIDRAKAISGRNEYRGLVAEGLDAAVGQCGAFQ